MYDELSKAKITDKRTVVISAHNNGGYTMAQKVLVEDEGRENEVFMKGSLIMPDIKSMKTLRDALNIAITKAIEKQKFNESSKSWRK